MMCWALAERQCASFQSLHGIYVPNAGPEN